MTYTIHCLTENGRSHYEFFQTYKEAEDTFYEVIKHHQFPFVSFYQTDDDGKSVVLKEYYE